MTIHHLTFYRFRHEDRHWLLLSTFFDKKPFLHPPLLPWWPWWWWKSWPCFPLCRLCSSSECSFLWWPFLPKIRKKNNLWFVQMGFCLYFYYLYAIYDDVQSFHNLFCVLFCYGHVYHLRFLFPLHKAQKKPWIAIDLTFPYFPLFLINYSFDVKRLLSLITQASLFRF